MQRKNAHNFNWLSVVQ